VIAREIIGVGVVMDKGRIVLGVGVVMVPGTITTYRIEARMSDGTTVCSGEIYSTFEEAMLACIRCSIHPVEQFTK
jgi:hypothetical protein